MSAKRWPFCNDVSLVGVKRSNTLICLVFSMKHYRGKLHAMFYRIVAVTDTMVVKISFELLPMNIIGQSIIFL